MTKLKLGTILDDRPVKLTVELPAGVYRDLQAYADILACTTTDAPAGAKPLDPGKLIAPMIERFMATDRAFAKLRKEHR